MQIKTQQYIGVAASVALMLLVGVTLAITGRDVRAALERSDYIREIVRGIGQHRFVMVEYILHHEERARMQWQAKQVSIDAALRTDLFRGAAEQAVVDQLRRRQEQIKTTFARLIDNYESRRDSAMSRELEARLVSRLLDISQAKIDDAYRLERTIQTQLEAAQRRASVLVAIAIALAALIVIGNAVLTFHNVLNPIARLQRGVEVLAKGELDFRTGIASDNEIGELSRGFDRMALRLQEAHAELSAKTRLALEANKELEAFSYSVSHDLRAPLRSMDGFSLALLEDYGGKLDEEGKDSLQRIRAASQRMGRLIDDLLALSQVTRAELNLAQVDLSTITREIADRFGEGGPGRAVQWQIADGLWVHADGALMRIAMQNLLDNAWKFTAKTPRATICVGRREHDGTQELFVADNGAGFDMAYADRLFGAFQRLHSAIDFPGTGIGLAIVQRVIRRHKGSLRAEATEGKGATFFFTLEDTENGSRG